MSLQSVQHKQILGAIIVIGALAILPALGCKIYRAYERHELAEAKISLEEYVLSAKDLTKPVQIRLADGNDYYMTVKANAPGCTTALAQRVLGLAADGKISAVEDSASVTGTFCNKAAAP